VTALAPAHGGYPGAVRVGVRPEPAGPERALFLAHGLAAGVEWLQSEQPEDAWVSQFGIHRRFGPYMVSVTPGPPHGASSGSVVIVHLTDDHRTWLGVPNGIDREERDAIEEQVNRVAVVVSAWNGESRRGDGCSFHIEEAAGPGVAQAYRNYHAGRLGARRAGPHVSAPEGWG
jgi:hypothetical protein